MRKRPRLFERFASPALPRWRTFGRNESGVTAIEFAILALPFFTIITAIMETALVFLAGQILDSSVQDASRLIRTGRAIAFDEAQFRAQICDGLFGLFDCTAGPNERLRINVSVIDDFASASPMPSPLKTGAACTALSCDWEMADDFAGGEAGKSSVVMVRAYYKWPTLVNLPGFNLSTLPDGSRLLGAARVFMNEPF